FVAVRASHLFHFVFFLSSYVHFFDLHSFPTRRSSDLLCLIASCTYPINESGADELLDVAGTHQFVLTRRHGDWAVFETPELRQADRKSTRLNSSHVSISYAVFCLKKKKKNTNNTSPTK